ncbi:glycosyltransferase [Vibrio cyclitrophicus]
MIGNWIKPNGISLLIAAQNEEKTIEMCIRSFIDFADEIIIVTNGSIDNTRSICKKLVDEFGEKVRFFDKPDLVDLYQNREFALTKSKFRWVMRGDADFIAYNNEDGDKSILKFRDMLLRKKVIYPTSFNIQPVNINYRWDLTAKSDVDKSKRIPYMAKAWGLGGTDRVFLNTPLLKFVRKGRWEIYSFRKFYNRIKIEKPLYFHCTLKSDKDLFFRSERTNWRELGDFNKYPRLIDYVEKFVLKEKYNCKSLDEAIRIYMEEAILPNLEEYNEDKYFPYPKVIKKLISNEIHE